MQAMSARGRTWHHADDQLRTLAHSRYVFRSHISLRELAAHSLVGVAASGARLLPHVSSHSLCPVQHRVVDGLSPLLPTLWKSAVELSLHQRVRFLTRCATPPNQEGCLLYTSDA